MSFWIARQELGSLFPAPQVARGGLQSQVAEFAHEYKSRILSQRHALRVRHYGSRVTPY